MRKTTQLFGGALLAAGLSATANAGFIITGNVPGGNYVGAYSGGFRGFSINADFWNETETSGTAFAQSLGSANTILNYANSGNTGLAYAIHFNTVSFEVTQDKNVRISWDFSGDVIGGSFIDSFISVDGPGGNIAFGDLNNPVDSVNALLSAGTTYTWFGQALASQGISEWSISKGAIPTPGTAVLLGVGGLGGLFATRRRRKKE